MTTWARGTVDSNAVALFKAMNGQRGSSFLEPDGIIMNPSNWQTTRLGTDSAGQFFGGGPFLGPYGGPQGPIGQSGQVTGALDSIWGKPVVVTTAIGAGTALVGAFSQAAQLFTRGGVTVEASNSHASYFEANLVKIRAEERLGSACTDPPPSLWCLVWPDPIGAQRGGSESTLGPPRLQQGGRMAKFTSAIGSPITIHFFDGRDPVRLEVDEPFETKDKELIEDLKARDTVKETREARKSESRK